MFRYFKYYSSQVIEGVEVLRELKSVSRSSVSSIQGPIPEPSDSNSHIQSHVDYITSLAVIPHKSHQMSQHFLVSSSHDGVIKLWK